MGEALPTVQSQILLEKVWLQPLGWETFAGLPGLVHSRQERPPPDFRRDGAGRWVTRESQCWEPTNKARSFKAWGTQCQGQEGHRKWLSQVRKAGRSCQTGMQKGGASRICSPAGQQGLRSSVLSEGRRVLGGCSWGAGAHSETAWSPLSNSPVGPWSA